MTISMPNLLPAIPEIFILAMACVLLLVGLFADRRQRLTFYLAQLSLVVAFVLTWFSYLHLDFSVAAYTFHDSFVLDRMAVILKSFIYLSTFLVFLYAHYYNEDHHLPNHEFYVLSLLSMLGMMILVSSHNLLTLYLGVELLSLPIYAMVALRRNKTACVEAAMKYFIIGAVASAMLLYGLSMIFGATLHLDMTQIMQAITADNLAQHRLLVFGLVFVIAGMAFKLGAAPFHMWAPDVYEGAPSSITLFISAAPKIAAFAMFIRLLVQTLPSLYLQWQPVLIVIAIASMAIGNLAAIVQTNIKRLLAYSSIAQMGYMLLGIACASKRGEAAAMFFVISYSLMTLGAFGMIVLMSRNGMEVENINDFAGLNSRHPWMAFLMLILMFSMAGVPPLVGFIAKVGILEALMTAHLTWLAVVMVIFAIIGVYYYIRVVKVMYFGDTKTTQPVSLSTTTGGKIGLSLNGIAVLLLGILPGALYAACHLSFFV